MHDALIFKGSNLTIREARLKNPGPIMSRIGTIMRARVRQTFADQGRAGVKWKARGVPNVAGIVKDAEMGRKSIPQRRFDARPAGIDTRLLARSISWRLAAPNVVEIGSTMPYASDVQRGGQRKIQVTAIARANLAPLIARAKKKVKKGSAGPRDAGLAKLGWLLWRSSFKINVPPRPFVFFSKQDRRDIGDMFYEYIRKPDKPPGWRTRP